MESEEKPEHLKLYEHLDDKVDKAIISTEYAATKARIRGQEALTDDKGTPQYGLLRNPDNYDKPIEAIFEVLSNAAKQHFRVEGTGVDKQEYHEKLVSLYTSLTKEELKNAMYNHKENFFKVFDKQVIPAILKRLDSDLRPVAYGHLEKEHIDDLVRFSNAEKYVKPENIRLDEAASLYRKVKNKKGRVTREALEEVPEHSLTDIALEEYYERTS